MWVQCLKPNSECCSASSVCSDQPWKFALLCNNFKTVLVDRCWLCPCSYCGTILSICWNSTAKLASQAGQWCIPKYMPAKDLVYLRSNLSRKRSFAHWLLKSSMQRCSAQQLTYHATACMRGYRAHSEAEDVASAHAWHMPCMGAYSRSCSPSNLFARVIIML